MTDVDLIITTYKNNLSLDSLIKLVIVEYKCNFVCIGWEIDNDFWVVPAILDTNIDSTTNLSAWYLTGELTFNNIPVRHSRLVSIGEIKGNRSKIIYGTLDPNRRVRSASSTPRRVSDNTKSINEFLFTVMLDRLSVEDRIIRQKNKLDLILKNITSAVKPPLDTILKSTSKIMKTDRDNTLTYKDGTLTDITLTDNTSTDNTLTDKDNTLIELNRAAVLLASNIFDILDITKLELGKLQLNKNVFNVRDLIASACHLVEVGINQHVIFNCHVEDSVPEYIYSDSKRIKQVLINLLDNAAQHTKLGEISLFVSGTLINLANEDIDRGKSLSINEVNSSEYQSVISFIIKDTGSGMTDVIKNGLFKPVSPIDNTVKTPMGLRISYLLAKVLNGDLKLVNSEIDRGSCFEFSLVVIEKEPTDNKTMKRLKDKTVLLVSDNETNTYSIINQLNKYKIKYVIATTYDEIQVLHSDTMFDLVIFAFDVIDDKLISDITRLLSCVTLLIGNTVDLITTWNIPTPYSNKTFKNILLEIFGSAVITDTSERILLIEKNTINRTIVVKMLRQLGYKSITAVIPSDSIVENIDAYSSVIIDAEYKDLIKQIRLSSNVVHIICQVDEIPVDSSDKHIDFIKKPIDFNQLKAKITAH